MPVNKKQNLRIDFLEELMDELINKKYSINQIIERGKTKGIPGLTYVNVRDILKERGIEFDKLSKEWKRTPAAEGDNLLQNNDFNPPIDNNETIINDNEALEVTKVKESIDASAPNPISKCRKKMPQKGNKKIEDLFLKVAEQEELVQELLRKISVIEEQLREKTEKSLSKSSSVNTLDVLKFVELSYSNGRRYEITIREDLVGKATEKLKSRYDLNSVDLTKISRLFEIILFDYINSVL